MQIRTLREVPASALRCAFAIMDSSVRAVAAAERAVELAAALHPAEQEKARALLDETLASFVDNRALLRERGLEVLLDA